MDLLLTFGVIFLVIALVAYMLGARGTAGVSASLGKTLLVVFLVLAVIIFLVRVLNGAWT